MTDFKNDINIFGDATIQSSVFIDNAATVDELEIGYFDGASIDCYGVRNTGTSGLFCFMPNSDNPQIILGSENNTLGSAFIDADNNRPLNLNTLDTGTGFPAVVNIGSGGLNVLGGGNITLTGLVDGVDINNPGGSIVINVDRYQLNNDQATPGNDKYYGTNPSGTKGWYDLPTPGEDEIVSCLAERRTSDGTQSLTNGSYTTLTWPFTAFENDDTIISHSETVNSSRITVQETGSYLCYYSLTLDPPGAPATSFTVRVIKNGVTTALPGSTRFTAEDDEANDTSNTFPVLLNAGDYVELQVLVNQTGAVTGTESNFGLTRLKGTKGDKGDTGAGSNINLEDDGVPVSGGPFDTINFVNATVTDGGGGTANVSAAPVYGTEYQYATKNVEESTTSGTFQQYFRLTTPSIPAGTYRISWFAVYNQSSVADSYSARIQIDDTTDLIDPANAGEIDVEVKDNGVNRRYPWSGFSNITFASAGSHTIDYDYRQKRGSTAITYQVNLEIMRVS